MKILAIDLGKYSSVACLWNGSNDGAEYRTVPTRPAEIHDLLVEVSPEQVIIEIGPAAGITSQLYANSTVSSCTSPVNPSPPQAHDAGPPGIKFPISQSRPCRATSRR